MLIVIWISLVPVTMIVSFVSATAVFVVMFVFFLATHRADQQEHTEPEKKDNRFHMMFESSIRKLAPRSQTLHRVQHPIVPVGLRLGPKQASKSCA